MIELINITKKYNNKVILNNISLSIKQEEYIAIIGQSGAGKSTLMNIIGTLDNEFEGDYYFENTKLTKSKEINNYRNSKIGFIFQQYNLVSNLSSFENILLPYVFCADKIPGINDRIDSLLDRFNLLEQKNQIINTLSGGEQQRIALVRSIVLNPDIIIADEPTGNLDKKNSEVIQNFLFDMNSSGKTIIIVTHDLELAKKSKRTYLISGGSISESI